MPKKCSRRLCLASLMVKHKYRIAMISFRSSWSCVVWRTWSISRILLARRSSVPRSTVLSCSVHSRIKVWCTKMVSWLLPWQLLNLISFSFCRLRALSVSRKSSRQPKERALRCLKSMFVCRMPSSKTWSSVSPRTIASPESWSMLNLSVTELRRTNGRMTS